MIIYTRCSRCKKRIEIGAVCPCYDKRRTEQGRDARDIFYTSSEWGSARAGAIRRTYGLDIFAFYEFGELVSGFTVHHITPLETAWELRTAPDNLIYLTEQNHRLIHEMYKSDYTAARERLHALLERFDREYGALRKSGANKLSG